MLPSDIQSICTSTLSATEQASPLDEDHAGPRVTSTPTLTFWPQILFLRPPIAPEQLQIYCNLRTIYSIIFPVWVTQMSFSKYILHTIPGRLELCILFGAHAD